MAAIEQRPDLCRLLLEYGVKPEPTSDNRSPLFELMAYPVSWSDAVKKTDIYRCFLDDVDLFDELNRATSHHSRPVPLLSASEVQLLWGKNLELVVSDEIRSNQRIIIRRFWTGAANTMLSNPELQFPDVSMSEDILNDIQYGHCHILRDLFRWCDKVMFSYVVGGWLLAWLIDLGLDLELFMASERANFKWSGYVYDREIIFKRDREQKWFLGFEWVFDHQAPGYTLVSEYTALAVEQDPGWSFWNWPFSESYQKLLPRLESDARAARFNRRMAAKERKERARSGKKQPRSRMPGAWKW